MTKIEFLQTLAGRLKGLPEEDIRKSLDFYEEMLDDGMEEGIPEEEAVASLGDMEEIVGQILAEIPLTKLVGHKLKPKRALLGWEIALLIVGAPLWIPLLVVATVLLLGAAAIFWSISLILFVVDLGFAVGGVAGTFVGFIPLFTGGAASGLVIIGGSIMLAGLAIPIFYLSWTVTKGLYFTSKKILLSFKRKIVGKEA